MAHLTSLFQVVLEASWQSSLVILLILLVRPVMGSAIPARWRHGLWLLVLIRLLVPVSLFPPTPVSLQNLAVMDRPLEQVQIVMSSSPATQTSAVLDEPRHEFSASPSVPASAALPTTPTPFSIPWWPVTATIWLAGMMLALGVLISAQFLLWRRIVRNRTPVEPAILAIWDECRRRLQIKGGPSLCVSPSVASPALVGLFRPVLLLPQREFTAFSPEDWENIFVHELAHYRRADHWTHALQLAALALHWFNPLAWYGFRQSRADRELAADEWALRHLDPERSTAYGETLLKILSESSGQKISVASVGILEDRFELKRRLQRIVGLGPRTWLGSFAGVCIVVAVAVLALGRSSENVDLSNYDDLKPDEILVTSAQRGDMPVIRKMLREGVEVNSIVKLDIRETALTAAVSADRQEAMRFLLSKGADVNLKVDKGPTTVEAAMLNGRTECAQYLLDHGATCDQAELAAFHGALAALQPVLTKEPADLKQLNQLARIAADNGQSEALRAISAGIKTQPGQTFWHLDDGSVLRAISLGHREVVQAVLDESPFAQKLNQGGVMRIGAAAAQSPGMRDWLISKGFTVPEYTDGERLIDATEHEDLTEIDRLLKKGVDINYRGESSWTPITKAAAWNKTRSIKFLLAHGADPNSVHLPGWDYTAICLTSKPEIADMVLAAGGNINATLYKRSVHIMDYSVTFGQTEMVKWYLAHGVDPTKVQADGPDRTFLFDAGNPEIASMLVQHGVDVKAKDKNGRTALLWICMFGKKPAETARVLLKNGADPNARDNDGWTPLMEARDGATVDVLVEYGADVHAKTKDGDSLLSAGGYNADPSWIQALIRHGATFNIKTDGPTKLMSAAWMGKLDVMSALLAEGVDPNLKGTWNKAANDYMTPLTAAVVDGGYDAAKLLVDRGARIDKQDMSDALANRRVSIIKLFWEHGAHTISPLTYAVSQGAPTQELEKLVDSDASANPGQGEEGALGEGALLGDFPTVQFLVERDETLKKAGQPEPKWFQGLDGPLNSAASEGQDEIVAYLLQHGAKPGFGDVIEAANNATPYSDELTKDHFEKTVKLLLDAGALKGISPQDSATVLQSAVFTRQGPGNQVVVKMLLDAGLNLDTPGKDGKTTMQAARENSTRTQGQLPPKELMAFLEGVEKK